MMQIQIIFKGRILWIILYQTIRKLNKNNKFLDYNLLKLTWKEMENLNVLMFSKNNWICNLKTFLQINTYA